MNKGVGRFAFEIVLLVLVAGGGARLGAAPDGRSQSQLLRLPYDSSATGQKRDCFLYLPVGYHTEQGRRWPVILFLHGGGERGDGLADLERVLEHGPLSEAWGQGRDLPFVILTPQLPLFGRELRNPDREPPKKNETGPPPPRRRGRRPQQAMARTTSGELPDWDENGPPQGWWMVEKDLLNLVDSVLRDYRTDAARVYLTGLSYGGFGSWHMAMAFPDRWAAIAPIAGAGDLSLVHRLVEAEMPVWVFQGGRDTLVRPERVLETVKALEEAGHPNVRFTVHEDLGHNAWTRVYEGWDLYGWFLSHRRR